MSRYLLLADGADEAGRMVGLAQGSDHFPLHKVPTAIAAGAVHALVVQRAQILSILHEEAPLGEVTAAYYTGHTHWHSASQFILCSAHITHKASDHQAAQLLHAPMALLRLASLCNPERLADCMKWMLTKKICGK